MRRRHLGLAWAASAASLAVAFVLSAGLSLRSQEITEPLPDRAAAAQTVSILRAAQEGVLEVTATGQGDDRVQISLRNTTPQRLQVVLPPGLVASAAASQFGIQSMGLGAPTRNEGSFGQFAPAPSGFQSVPVEASTATGIALGSHQTTEITVPAVCLNYGLPTPTPRHEFRLVDVDDYTQDARARKALRSLATVGTSQKVAQAVAWHVFNGMTFDQMANRAGRKLNNHELALASRFVQALDSSGASDLVENTYFQEGRLFARIRGSEAQAADIERLDKESDGLKIMGLPVQIVDEPPAADTTPCALWMDIAVTSITPSQVIGRVALKYSSPAGDWISLGSTSFQTAQDAASGAGLADALNQSVAASYVRVKVTRRETGLTTLTLENRLPLTLAHVVLQAGAGSSSSGGPVQVDGLGLSPARQARVSVPAEDAKVARIEFNGL